MKYILMIRRMIIYRSMTNATKHVDFHFVLTHTHIYKSHNEKLLNSSYFYPKYSRPIIRRQGRENTGTLSLRDKHQILSTIFIRVYRFYLVTTYFFTRI